MFKHAETDKSLPCSFKQSIKPLGFDKFSSRNELWAMNTLPDLWVGFLFRLFADGLRFHFTPINNSQQICYNHSAVLRNGRQISFKCLLPISSYSFIGNSV